ncbi:MAG: sigma-70 family RNA polymerase sigma factor [Acidobacteria bacterium]|nr:sigma-70 family RNA polymerase sigma factor [Acidobacteriota bacterium]
MERTLDRCASQTNRGEEMVGRDDDMDLEDFLRGIYPKLRAAMSQFQVPIEDAEDVVQQALLALVYQWGTIRDPEAWLIGTVRNKCRLYWRERRRRLYEAVDTMILEWMAEGAGPRQERTDVLRDLNALVSRLPPRCRDILRLRYGLGYSPPEVAERLGYQASSISKVTSRCLAALVDQMVRRGFCRSVDLESSTAESSPDQVQ